MVSPTALKESLPIFSEKVDIVSFSNADTDGNNGYLPTLGSFQA